ncbi:unnamed protein product [Sphenostylis stenocarpa]|uniref:Uncharacterized protein n=1 Tax=Sphenostylis stenocarpa TaxID=92480 RepID=A0AA86S1K4_9FABA|nr:unnamed protein product [Sphenostylis stenocarpa]
MHSDGEIKTVHSLALCRLEIKYLVAVNRIKDTIWYAHERWEKCYTLCTVSLSFLMNALFHFYGKGRVQKYSQHIKIRREEIKRKKDLIWLGATGFAGLCYDTGTQCRNDSAFAAA